jgi:hypothetical protein
MQGFKIQRDYRRRGLPGHSGVKVDVVVEPYAAYYSVTQRLTVDLSLTI